MCPDSSEQVPHRTSHNHHPLVKKQTSPCSLFKHYKCLKEWKGEKSDTERAEKREVTLCGGEQQSSSMELVRIMQNFFHTRFYPYCVDKVGKVNGVVPELEGTGKGSVELQGEAVSTWLYHFWAQAFWDKVLWDLFCVCIITDVQTIRKKYAKYWCCWFCTIHYNSLLFQFSLYIDKLQV